MWFRRYWSVFVFTPVGFVVGFAYSVLTSPHLTAANHMESAGRDTGSAIFGALIACVALIAYNRSRKIEPKKKPEPPPSN
jgi:hypothetical protein